MARKRNADTDTVTTTPEVPEMTSTETAAPAFDIFALAETVTKAEAPIVRERRTESKYANNPFRARVAESLETGETLELPVPGIGVKTVVAFIRNAAKDAGHGVSVSHPVPYNDESTDPVTVKFQSKPAREIRDNRTECPVCHNEVSITSAGQLRTHGPRDSRCSGSGRQLEA